MAKNIMQDVVKVKNNSSKKDTYEPRKLNDSKSGNKIVSPKSFFYNKHKLQDGEGNSRYHMWIVAFVAIVFLFFSVSYLFSNAKITIVPKSKDFVVEQTSQAVKNVKTDDTESVSYNTVVLSGDESIKVSAGDEKDYLKNAEGVMLLYNNFNSSPQTLLSDTKLEGSNGKIYKTKSKVTIPGTGVDGSPGKERVGIYAVSPGAEYNSIGLDFKISGFKGTAKYEKIYGRSVGDIAGGLKGKSRQVSDEDKAKAENTLKQTLSDKLYKKAMEQTPEKFILFRDANIFNVDSEVVAPVASDGTAQISIKGTFYGFILNKDEISQKIMSQFLEDGEKSGAFISNLSQLKFSSNNIDMSLFNTESDTADDSIGFSLSGPVKIVWTIDKDKIISDLLGRNKSDFDSLMTRNGNIESATSVIKPVWRSSFPDKINKIEVIVNYP